MNSRFGLAARLATLFFALTLWSMAASKLISKTFTNAPVTSVIRYLAGEMGRTVTLAPEVKGNITISFEQVTPEQALQQLLKALGNKYAVIYPDAGTLTVAAVTQEESGEKTPEPLVDQAMKRPASPKLRGASTGYPAQPRSDFNTESYDKISETGFKVTKEAPLSTFSIDVDTASYANVRRFLQQGQKPPKDAVRIEEMLNYFSYTFPTPDNDEPFAVSTELAACPWNTEHRLLQIGLAAPKLKMEKTPRKNLVFLLDVSGSMEDPDKLPLLKGALRLLVKTLRAEDRVAIVVYAGASGVVLEPTSGEDQVAILAALDKLQAGGSTNGGAGIELAYKLAQENFDATANNRVILATDGDFNVGVASRGDLVRLIEEKRSSGVYLSVLGFGQGNLKDSQMEELADKGNGNYAYIDTLLEAKKVLVEEGGGTLTTVAKDVKLQLEFNPLKVHSYRLIGYENRRLENEDFADDKKDAGDMGAGHTVTALYEIVPGKSPDSNLRYQGGRESTEAAKSNEVALVKVRYKEPTQVQSKLREFVVADKGRAFDKASENLRFAAGVASVGMLMRDSEFKGSSTLAQAKSWAEGALGKDEGGYRREFLRLVELYQGL